jgi:hypothetical protein
MLRSIRGPVCLAALLLVSACATIHNKQTLSSGQDPRTTMISVYSLHEPPAGFIEQSERMIRVTERQTSLMTGDKSLTIRWRKKKANLVLLEGDNSIYIALSPYHLSRGETEIVRVIKKDLFTGDPVVLEILELLWEQLTKLTYYDNPLTLDSPFLDIELYNGSGVVRRMTLYAPWRPDYEDLASQALLAMCDLVDAANADKFHEGCKLQYETLVKRNPSFRSHYALSLSQQLAWIPDSQKILQKLKALTSEMVGAQTRLESGIIPVIDVGDGQVVPFDPNDGHLPSENNNYYFPCNNDEKNKK